MDELNIDKMMMNISDSDKLDIIFKNSEMNAARLETASIILEMILAKTHGIKSQDFPVKSDDILSKLWMERVQKLIQKYDQ